MADERFARLVRLACHDLRTPLATVNGVAALLQRPHDPHLPELPLLISAAAGEMNALLDSLTLATRIASGGYEPALEEVDSVALLVFADARVGVSGVGSVVRTDPGAVRQALAALAAAVLRHGGAGSVAWEVSGATLRLAPVSEHAWAAIDGPSPLDLGALVAFLVLEALGATLSLERETLRIELV